jgi:serine/threonine-protein kinase
MTPQKVAELSRLLDEVLALAPAQRESWLAELERSNLDTARHLRSMLAQTAVSDTALLPKLPRADEDAVAQAGERVGPYVLVREIGRGGMGSVWLADRADGAFKRRVALKLPRLTWSAGLAKRMARERDVGALLEHPNVARLYDAGVDDHGRPYIAYEYIEGRPLDAYCRDHALDLRARLKLFAQVMRAVAFAHSRLVLHRDIKPSNVLVDAEGNVHLLDFGIAKLLDETASDLTQEQGRLMTLSYAAPEQILGRPLSVAADVYSLGVVLYELLTGTLPYSAKRNTAAAMEEAILAGDAPLASSRVTDRRQSHELRGDLNAIVGKALKSDPNQRYPSAEALAADIQRFLDGQPIAARPDSAWYRLRKAVVRHRVPVAAIFGVVVVALIGAVTTWMQGRQTAAEAERARIATAFVSELFRINAAGATVPEGSHQSPGVFVDRGAQLIEARFHSQPEVKAELYGALARVYTDLGANKLATEYATRQLEALRSQRAGVTDVARSLMLLGEVGIMSARDQDAETHTSEAVRILPRDHPLRPEALALLALTQLQNAKLGEATRSLADGRASIQQLGARKSPAIAWLTYVEGTLIKVDNRFDDALPLFQAAIAHAVEVEGPNSLIAAEIRLVLSHEMINRRQGAEARALADAAVQALSAIGGTASVRAALRRSEFQTRMFEADQSTYEEATQVLEEISSFLRANAAVIPPEAIAWNDFQRARILTRWGEYTKARPLLDSSASVLLDTQSLSRRWRIVAILGDAAMTLGEHKTADRWLRECIEIRTKMGRGSHPWAAWDWAFYVQNLSMWGRHGDAEAVLAGAPHFPDLDRSGSGDYSTVLARALTRVRLDAGDFQAALKSLPTTEPRQEDSENYLSSFQLRGETRCGIGDAKAGLADLKRSIKSQSERVSENDPWIARLRAVAGLCALSLGQRRQAEEFAAQARNAFAAQPDVSPYFKEPLIRLERQLRSKT